VEAFLYRLLGVSPRHSMRVGEYLASLLLVNALVIVWISFLLVSQGSYAGSVGVPPMRWDLAFHTAASFATNTDFTHYTPGSQMSQAAALVGLQIAMFLSASTGLAAAAAFVRGFVRRDGTLGNFYVDTVRSLTRVVVPLSLLGAVILVVLGVPETFRSAVLAHTLSGGTQVIPLGPVASWQSLDLIGTNGGGFYSANAASPLANPSPVSNLVEIALMMLIPFSFPFAFGHIVRQPGEAAPLMATILTIFLIALGMFLFFETQGNPALSAIPGLSTASGPYAVGYETRFSLPESALFNVVSVYGNVGANNALLGSVSPGAQSVLLFGMFTQSTPGGDGTGFGMLLVFVVLAVFVGGLMVGRTPEYLGKKIGNTQVKWAAAALLGHPFAILVPLGIAILGGFVMLPSGSAGASAHTFTAVLYEFTSEASNNGSAIADPSLADNTLFFNLVGALIVLFGRFFPIAAMLMIGSGFAQEPILPPGPGTLRTRSATFSVYLSLFIVIVSGLLFLPVLALGPLGQI
jgi:K+-transporting ATPase ATPase A chain